MCFRKIRLIDQKDFLACTIATTVLRPDIRNLGKIAEQVIANGWDWCVENKDPEKLESWWRDVELIHENFLWENFLAGDPITAKVYNGSLEFGSIGGYGGGCHRTIALATLVLSNRFEYKSFDIKLFCP